MVLDNLLKGIKLACGTALLVVLLQISYLMPQLQETLPRLESEVAASRIGLLFGIAKTQSDLRAEVSATRDALVGQIAIAEKDVLKTTQGTVLLAGEKIDYTNAILEASANNATVALVRYEQLLDKHLTSANGSFGLIADQFPKISKDITRIALPTSLLLDQINEQAPGFLNCDPRPAFPHGNKYCAFNQYTSFVTSANQIAFDVRKFTDKAVAKPTKKQRLWEGIKLGVYAGSKLVP